jgi:valine dehydrogenase (NAD+)
VSASALELAEQFGHEELLMFRAAGQPVVVAIHSTALGPAAGGTRMQPYPSLEAAALDALRLSRAMTYKAALADVDRGGAKAVIVGDPATQKSRALLNAFAKAVERLNGRFHTGCDMGIDGRDVAVMSRLTRHVSHTAPGSALDAADLAALGVFESIRTAALLLDLRLAELRVAVQRVLAERRRGRPG